MRFFNIFAPAALAVCAALLAPGAGLAQPGGSQSYYNCTALNSYTQFCEYVVATSSLSISPNGQITVNANTEANWGIGINQIECEDNSDGNPYACQPPSIPSPSTSVFSEILQTGAYTSASGSFDAQLTLTAQASQAGTYTEQSNHYAFFDTTGDQIGLETQASQSYTPPVPTVTSISPDTWQAGTSTPVTITGTNFGTSPSVSLSGDSYVSWTTSGTSTGTTIYGTVTIDPSDPGGETVTVTVTPGGSGNNFGSGGSGGSGSGSNTATVVGGGNPCKMVVVSDYTNLCPGCSSSVQRKVTYQVMTQNANVGVIGICEVPDLGSANSGPTKYDQNVPPMQITARGLPGMTSSSGQFIDNWSLNQDFTPVGCGYPVNSDAWYGLAVITGVKTTLGTLSGYVYTNAVNINNSVTSLASPTGMAKGTVIPGGGCQ
ncbi:MAG: IPT/TIG domain-containing protein [Bryobacteraceae bacterium]